MITMKYSIFDGKLLVKLTKVNKDFFMKRIILLLILVGLAFSQETLRPKTMLKSKAPKILNTSGISSRIMLDTSKSSLEWNGGLKVINKEHYGTLKFQQGTLFISSDKSINGTFVVNLRTLVNTDLSGGSKDRLEGHLRSQDFFDVEKYPTAKLVITKSSILVKVEEKKYRMLIQADLTIKNQTHPISFEAILDLDSKIKTATGSLEFDRLLYGVQYRAERYLDDPSTFWNKIVANTQTSMDKVIRDLIKVDFNISTTPNLITE